MESNQEQGKAIPFVVYSNKNFIITDEAKQLLSNPIYKQIGIISLVGKYRTGKSFLLNRVLLNEKNESGFGVGPSIKPCTKGIWMWSKPILVENNHSKEKFHSFFIDTEGLGAYDEEINHDSKIFLVAVLISSLFILNSFGNIDENAINTLSFIINLSKTIKLKQSSSEANPEDLSAYFPSLLWLLRDFSLKLEDTHGNVITAKQYLENALQLQKGSSETVEEKNKIRKLITSYFKERDCFSMVRPIENEKDLQNLQSLDNSLIRREFLEQAETLRHKVFKKVKPKVFNGKILSGSMLIELLDSIVDSINKGAVPVIENSWKYMLHNESVRNLNNCLDKFNSKLLQFKENNKENPNFFKDLKKFENETLNELMREFRTNSISAEAPETTEFIGKLKTRVAQEFEKFNEDNFRLFENRMSDALERHTKKIYDAFETDKYVKNYYIFFRDLENLKEISDSTIPDFKNKKELIFEKMIEIVKKFIEVTFLKNKILNEKEIASLKNENRVLSGKLTSRNEEYEKLKADSQTQLEKLNSACVELKLKEKTFEDKFKQLLQEKKNAQQSAEEKINSLKSEMNAKLEKLKADLTKAEADLKNKDDHIKMIKFSEDKMSALNAQKLEYLERDLLSYKERVEGMKYDNTVLKATVDEQAGKLDKMQEEVNKVRLLEMENERLRKDNENLLEKKTAAGNLFAPKFRERQSNNFNKANDNSDKEENDYGHGDGDDSGDGLDLVCASKDKRIEKFGVECLDPNSDAYVLLQLIKDVLNQQAGEQSSSLMSLKDGVTNKLEKISKENEDYLIMNKNLSENLINFEKRYSLLEQKNESLKRIKDAFKQVAAVQCKNCSKLIDSQSFLKYHVNNCSKRDSTPILNPSDKLKIKILKGVLSKDELGKPFIEYITEISFNTQIWKVNRKFNQFANLHKSLKSLMGEDFKFPESSNIFTKIVENSNFHENKIKYLEAYVREISEIPMISNSKIFRKFFDFHLNTEENYNLYIESPEAAEKLNTFRASNRQSNASYHSENSDSNKEEAKINSNYGFANTYRNSSNYSSHKNNFYADSEGKITFENNNSGQKNKADNNYNLNSNRSSELNRNSK